MRSRIKSSALAVSSAIEGGDGGSGGGSGLLAAGSGGFAGGRVEEVE